MRLYTFWRSIATFRVRIALNLKGIKPDETVYINLIEGDQRAEAYRAVNPQMVIPALIDGDGPLLFQSMAIMEYLDETRPEPPIMPKDAHGRARVRGLSLIAIADAHPMSVPRMRNYLTNDAGFSQEQMLTFVRHWQNESPLMRRTSRVTRRPVAIVMATPSRWPTSASPRIRSARASSMSASRPIPP